MKTFSLLVALAALVILQAGCEQTPAVTGDNAAAGAKPSVVEGDVNTVSFNVPGMTCEGCAAMVEETLAGTSGIEKCSVDLEHKIANCKINPDKFKAEDVLKALADAGYKDSTVKN
jgi:copper chaperone CopZ